MELPRDKKLKAYKAILPLVERDNMMPICILLGEHLSKKIDEQKKIWCEIDRGNMFPEIKIELANQKNRDYFFRPETRVPFIKNQIEILKQFSNI